MAPDYHQLEFDLRLWLTARELASAGPAESVELDSGSANDLL